MRLIQNYETKTAESKKKARRQSFHDVLTVDSIRHKSHRSRMSMFIGRRADARWFNYNVIYDTSSNEEIGR